MHNQWQHVVTGECQILIHVNKLLIMIVSQADGIIYWTETTKHYDILIDKTPSGYECLEGYGPNVGTWV